MARSLLKAEFNEQAMTKKLKKLGKVYGDSQKQAIKRWGVQTCREMARKTIVMGNKPRKHKEALFKDATKVIYTYKGRAAKKPNGLSIESKSGSRIYISNKRVLNSEEEVDRWIEQNRTGSNKRTRLLPIDQKKVCSNALLRRAINRKHKLRSGMAKDGWLDAGDHIGRGQRGSSKIFIGKSFMKFARKTKRYGSSTERTRAMFNVAEVHNHLPYTRNSYVLKNSHKRQALRDGMVNTLRWYRKVIRAENRKKK